MPATGTIKMSASQFLELGEDPPGVRLELADGEILVSPSPIPEHSYVDTMLRIILGKHIRAKRLGRLYGDVDTIFGIHDVRRPDLIFFSRDRLHLIGKKAMEGPPDLCVEILSPNSTRIDRKDKFRLYQKSGVAHYWIVDPGKRMIQAYRLIGRRFRDAGSGSFEEVVRLPPFEDLDIPLGELWQPEE
jgi:Uma2 family endonuclease